MKRRTTLSIAVLATAVATFAVVLLTMKREQVRMPDLLPRSSPGSASSEYINAQKAIAYYREEIRKKPEVVKNYVELAQVYLQEARITALHHAYFPRAEQLLDHALALDPSDVNALTTRASMYATLHHFEEAKTLAQKALALNRYSAATYKVLIDALVELGEYDEAVQTCDALLAFRPDLGSYARASYLREIHGNNAGAREAMRMACDAGTTGSENRAWALYTFGKLFLNEGKLDTAEYIFNGILEERPDYAYALGGLAQVKQAHRKFDEALDLLHRAYRATPDHTFLEQLVVVYQAAGRERESQSYIKKVLDEFADHRTEGWNVDREFAAFCADQGIHLEEALSRAENEYRRRPNNIEVLETYAWVLHRLGRSTEAQPLIERALRFGTQHAALLCRAAAIRLAAGDVTRAQEDFYRARHINPYITILFESVTKKLAEQLPPLATR